MCTVLIYEPDMYSHVCASLLLGELWGQKGKLLRVPISRTENFKEAVKKNIYEVLTGPPLTVIAMGAVSDINSQELVSSFPYTEFHFILSKKKEIKGTEEQEINQYIGAGEDIYDALESILSKVGLGTITKLSSILFLLCRRTSVDDQEAKDGEKTKVFIRSIDGSIEEKIKASLKVNSRDIIDGGSKIVKEVESLIRKKVEGGKLIRISEENVWLFESESSILEGLRLSSRLHPSIKLHLCKYTKESKDRTFFTLWTSDEKLDAGGIAVTFGGGGSKVCGGWNMSNTEAEKWLSEESLVVKDVITGK